MNSYIAPFPSRHSPNYPWRWGALVALLAGTVVAAAIGTIASLAAPSFYMALNRPNWAPPPGLFGPVWSVLYLLMAIAAWTVVRVRDHHASGAIALYAVQLAANALWTWLFFHWHTGAGAFADIVALWLLIVATIIVFWRAHVVAGVLLLPYLAWVSFATALTWTVWHGNPGVL